MNLDLNRARLFHSTWRLLLRQYLEGSAPADPSLSASPRECEFGKWLYATGIARYADLADMSALELAHARMHEVAAQVMRLKEAGQCAEARQKYATAAALSERVVGLLAQLEERVQEAPEAEQDLLKPWPGSR